MSESEKQIIRLLGDLLSKIGDHEILLQQVVAQQQAVAKGVDKISHAVDELEQAATAVMQGESPPSKRELSRRCGLNWNQFCRWTAPDSTQPRVRTAFLNFERCKEAIQSFATRDEFSSDDFIDDADRRIDLD